jgi:2'-hydroxyisoflavone reductase
VPSSGSAILMKLLILSDGGVLETAMTQLATKQDCDVTLLRDRRSEDMTTVANVVSESELADSAHASYWDAAIDLLNRSPAAVRATANFLNERVGRYVLLSSNAIYADMPTISSSGLTGRESTPSVLIPWYEDGLAKAQSEYEIQSMYGQRSTVVRAGEIVGQWEPAPRLRYWLSRSARGGEVVAPGRANRLVNVIDATDLLEFILHLVRTKRAGGFHATGPTAPITMRDVLEECRATVKGHATFTWISDSFLERCHVASLTQLPLWYPGSAGIDGLGRADFAHALSAGLKLRPIEETIASTWQAMQSEQPGPAAGLSSARESEILRRWHQLSQAYSG